MAGSVDEEALHQLYLWVDNIPLSRPKRNLSRDFSDGGVCSNVCECVRTHAWVSPVCLCAPLFRVPALGLAGLHSLGRGLGGALELINRSP